MPIERYPDFSLYSPCPACGGTINTGFGNPYPFCESCNRHFTFSGKVIEIKIITRRYYVYKSRSQRDRKRR